MNVINSVSKYLLQLGYFTLQCQLGGLCSVQMET